MKRKEFIAQVEKLGYRCFSNKKFINVGTQEDYLILTISDTHLLSIDTISDEFEILQEKDKKQLFTLATKYAATPLEDREEKKYVIRDKDGIGLKYLIWYSFPSIGWKYTSKEDEENIILNSLKKAQAQALLVDGEVEEV